MTLKELYTLKIYLEAHTDALEHILEDYRHYVDGDMALFIQKYVGALQLDFELAMTRGEKPALERIIEDVRELRQDTETRLQDSKENRCTDKAQNDLLNS